MSNAFYMKLWQETEKLLDEALEIDLSLQDPKNKFRNLNTAQTTVFTLYVKYISLVKNLDECYDQIVQPQKRPMLRKLLDMCIGENLRHKHRFIHMCFSICFLFFNLLQLCNTNVKSVKNLTEILLACCITCIVILYILFSAV